MRTRARQLRRPHQPRPPLDPTALIGPSGAVKEADVSSGEEAFDRLTRLAAKTTRVPIAVLTLIDGEHHSIKSSIGIPESSAPRRPSLSEGLFAYVASGQALVINNIREHPLRMAAEAFFGVDIATCAGIPLIVSAGHAVGSLWVADVEPRGWGGDELAILADLAALVVGEVERRLELKDHTRSEQAFRDAEARFRTVAETVSAGILIAHGSEIRYANSAVERITGYSRTEIAAMNVLDIVHPDFRPFIQQRIRARQRGEPLAPRFEVKFVTKGGDARWAEINVAVAPLDRQPALVAAAFDITERKEAEEQLGNSRRQLRALLARLEEIREEERRRIAREIHDELGQALTGLKIDLAWLARGFREHAQRAPSRALATKVRSMIRLIDTTIKSVRSLATELRPGVLDEMGLVPAIEWQLEEFRSRTGIACRLSTNVEKLGVARTTSAALFRVFQEALTNVTRHAHATRVDVFVRQNDGLLALEVKDNGKGILPRDISHPQSLGLLGMRERVLHLGGTMTVAGAPNVGTTVTVQIPVEPAQT